MQDPDLQSVMLWLEAEQRPPWEEMAAHSPFTKGLCVKFHCLRLIQGVLQRAWCQQQAKRRWQIVVPRNMPEALLKAVHSSSGFVPVGELMQTTQGNHFILTAMDYFTKWASPLCIA